MRTLTTACICLLLAALAPSASAQDYGVGETVIVPEAPADSIVIDGTIEVDVWDQGANIDLLANTSWWSGDFPQDIVEATAQVLYVEDTLYVHVFIDEDESMDSAELFNNTDAPWYSDQILIGIDPVHEPGVTDVLVDQDDWAGWPENAPDLGPYAYKVSLGGGITLNWGEVDASQWTRGAVYTDEENVDWGLEAAFYVPTIEDGAEIGFNIGGAQAGSAACETLEGECAYGFYSLWSTENPGSDVNSRTDSYGTLQMGIGGGDGYGGGNVVQVPQVDPGSIVIDGQADEAAWADAQMDINATAHWNAYGPVGEATPTPDLLTQTRLLWSEDTLYVHHLVQDIEIFWGGDAGNWSSDMLLLGIDNSLEGDSLFGPGFDGGAENAPEGVYTYFINEPAGFTFAWMAEPVPADSGWVNGEVFVDEENLEWGIEAAFYVPNAAMDAMIGFDIGGAQASADQCGEGYCDYAYYAWQTGAGGVDPGMINRDASQWAALHLVEEMGTAIEETPGDGIADGFALSQNYPNPFRGSTRLSYALPESGHVQLTVYDVLGRQVARLVDGARAANSYDVEWQSEELPGGLYVYRLVVDGSTIATRTMTVVK